MFCIKGKAMSNNAMSDETDLDWLARNVHVWREGKREVLVCWPRNVDTLICSSVSKDQWLARRAELQNKPSWGSVGSDINFISQHDDGQWIGHSEKPSEAAECFECNCVVSLFGYGEVLGDWRDTLEKRPTDLSEQAVTERLTEATQTVLAAAPALMDEKYSFEPEFMPVSVSNETVQLERPIAVAGTGNGSAAESAFLIGRVIDLLRTSVDHFSANELAELHQLCDAELTKRDAAVCGGQKYLDAQWFERGELPPVGTVCLYVVSDRLSAEVEITAHAKLGLCFVQVGQSGESYVSKTAELHRFRPIRTEREVAIEEMCNVAGLDGLVFGLVAGELYDAGYRKQNLPAK